MDQAFPETVAVVLTVPAAPSVNTMVTVLPVSILLVVPSTTTVLDSAIETLSSLSIGVVIAKVASRSNVNVVLDEAAFPETSTTLTDTSILPSASVERSIAVADHTFPEIVVEGVKVVTPSVIVTVIVCASSIPDEVPLIVILAAASVAFTLSSPSMVLIATVAD